MTSITREQILADMLVIVKGLSDGWEYSGEITPETGFFNDLGFESIDAVALGTTIEEHYRQSFPFAQFLAEFSERGAKDITVGEVVDFIQRNLSPDGREGGR